jgi:DNA-binding NarL/FixJ family response regulator
VAWPPAPGAEQKSNSKLAGTLAATGERVMLVHAATEARAALREAAFAAAEAAARARSVADELEQALAALNALETDSPRVVRVSSDCSQRVADRLSPREREVLALVAEGRSNKAIAEALYVSPNTVKTHVASLLTKLDADTRVQLAALAVQDCVH